MLKKAFAICCYVILSSFCVMATSPQLSNSLPNEKDFGKMSEAVFQSLQNIVRCSQYPCEPESPSKRRLRLPPAPPSGGDSPCSLLCAPSTEESFSLEIGQYWRFPTINGSESFSSSDDSELLVLPPNSGCGKCYGRDSDACEFASDVGMSDSGSSTSSSNSPQTDGSCSDTLFSGSSIERSKSTGSLDI